MTTHPNPLKRLRNAPRHVRLRARRGFLLMDALIAAFVGLVVLVAACSLVVSGAAAAEVARQNNTAYNAARQIVENVRLRRGASLLPNGTYTDLAAFGPVPQIAALREGSARVVIGNYRPTVRQVTVTVTWRAGQDGGRTRTRTITALVAPRGVAP